MAAMHLICQYPLSVTSSLQLTSVFRCKVFLDCNLSIYYWRTSPINRDGFFPLNRSGIFPHYRGHRAEPTNKKRVDAVASRLSSWEVMLHDYRALRLEERSRFCKFDLSEQLTKCHSLLDVRVLVFLPLR